VITATWQWSHRRFSTVVDRLRALLRGSSGQKLVIISAM
jgi:hypothetical protein